MTQISVSARPSTSKMSDDLQVMMDDWLSDPHRTKPASCPALPVASRASAHARSPLQARTDVAVPPSSSSVTPTLPSGPPDVTNVPLSTAVRGSSPGKTPPKRSSLTFSGLGNNPERVAEQQEFLRSWGQITTSDSTSILPTYLAKAPPCNKRKCSPVFVGGSSREAPRGLNASSCGGDQVPCSNLRCLKCDMPVLEFDDFAWDATVSYIFLRTTYPSASKLRQHLQKSPGSCARVCQCSWLSNSEVTVLDPSTVRWVCAGHQVPNL